MLKLSVINRANTEYHLIALHDLRKFHIILNVLSFLIQDTEVRLYCIFIPGKSNFYSNLVRISDFYNLPDFDPLLVTKT